MRWHRGMMQAAGIETVGEARGLGWSVIARCTAGRRRTMKTHHDCGEGTNLDMETLVWTRGADFPLSRLEGHLKCPRCGSRNVALIFNVPPVAIRAQAAE